MLIYPNQEIPDPSRERGGRIPGAAAAARAMGCISSCLVDGMIYVLEVLFRTSKTPREDGPWTFQHYRSIAAGLFALSMIWRAICGP